MGEEYPKRNKETKSFSRELYIMTVILNWGTFIFPGDIW